MRRLMMILALTFATATPACELVGPALVTTISTLLTEMIDARQRLEALDRAADEWFKEYPNAALEADWDTAHGSVVAAIDVALATAHGAEELSQADYFAAAAHFVAAYNALATLARQIGILGAGDVLGAGPQQGLVLEPPLACRRSLAAQ